MVSVKFGDDYAIDMRDYTYDFDDLPSVTSVSYSSTYLRGRLSDGTYVSIDGKGFSYDKSTGVPNGGEIHSITETRYGTNLVSITGLHLAVKDLVKVALTATWSDDLSLVKSILSGDDSIYGSRYADVLLGYKGNDILSGKAGNDKLYGSDGNDLLYGGAGHDSLNGGAGSDTFSFRSISDSTLSSAGRDTIYDFSSQDKIDLAGIDANQKVSGDQAFTYIGKAAFHGKAGELRFEKQASDTYIYGDVNGDKKTDFAVHLDDAVDIFKAYFLL